MYIIYSFNSTLFDIRMAINRDVVGLTSINDRFSIMRLSRVILTHCEIFPPRRPATSDFIIEITIIISTHVFAMARFARVGRSQTAPIRRSRVNRTVLDARAGAH